MQAKEIEPSFSLETALQAEHARLIRLCARLSGDAHAADDLAQETFIEAWRNAHKLVDPSGYRPWLSAIARNVCYRWARKQGRELAYQVDLETDLFSISPTVEVHYTAANNLDQVLEQDDLANLLDRAMAILPKVTRQIMLERYFRQRPQAEIAAKLGLSENAVAVRLHRGKSTLRQILSTTMRAEALAYGLILPMDDGWQETRIWCPQCGQRRLKGQFSGAHLALRCIDCAEEAKVCLTERQLSDGLIENLKGYKPALSKALKWGHDYYAPGLGTGRLPCYACGHSAALIHTLPEYAPTSLRGQRGFYMSCDHCAVQNYGTLVQFVLSLPTAQQFWRQHPRMHLLPEQRLNTENRNSLSIILQSVTHQAKLTIVLDEATYQPLAIYS